MKTLSARRYPNTRAGRLSEAEAETRRLAYAIKDPQSPAVDFAFCAHQMAQLITGPCWLVPIPSSQGSTRANGLLAAQIASFVPGAQVAHALRRTRPVESQCARHKANLGPHRRRRSPPCPDRQIPWPAPGLFRGQRPHLRQYLGRSPCRAGYRRRPGFRFPRPRHHPRTTHPLLICKSRLNTPSAPNGR